MKTSTNHFHSVSKVVNITKLAYLQKRLSRMIALRGLATGLIGLLFLLTQCQPLIEEDPQPRSNTNAAVSLQTVENMEGVVAQVECTTETLSSGEIIHICIPAHWNGELLLYARGYTPAFEPLHIASEASVYAPLFTSFGYAFATTSYSQNGLAVQTGIQDMINLRNLFIERYGEPEEIYLAGASEGGLVTTLAIERYPELWSGGLSLCGPCGDFQRQINYYGNFRVLFDYFFPGVLPGNVLDVPDEMILNWETVYVPAILQAISQDPVSTLKLLNTAQAPYDPSDPNSIVQTVLGVLRYNLFIRDAIIKLGGQPFDNQDYVYSGKGSATEDRQLNLEVQRVTADKEATKNIKKYYETKGIIKKPLVKSHTTSDPIALFWNLTSYQDKVPNGKSALFEAIPVQRYGHCTFTEAEAVAVFSQLVQKVDAQKQHPLAKVKGSGGKIIRSVTVAQKFASAR
jgi:pimeloyl-ACP methyl ester carboxylesterase